MNELNDFTDRDSLFYRKKYLQQIVDHGKVYYDYAHWAYDTIFKRVVGSGSNSLTIRCPWYMLSSYTRNILKLIYWCHLPNPIRK